MSSVSCFNLWLSVSSFLLLPENRNFMWLLHQGCDKQSAEVQNGSEIGQNFIEIGSWGLRRKLSGNNFSDFQLLM